MYRILPIRDKLIKVMDILRSYPKQAYTTTEGVTNVYYPHKNMQIEDIYGISIFFLDDMLKIYIKDSDTLGIVKLSKLLSSDEVLDEYIKSEIKHNKQTARRLIKTTEENEKKYDKISSEEILRSELKRLEREHHDSKYY